LVTYASRAAVAIVVGGLGHVHDALPIDHVAIAFVMRSVVVRERLLTSGGMSSIRGMMPLRRVVVVFVLVGGADFSHFVSWCMIVVHCGVGSKRMSQVVCVTCGGVIGMDLSCLWCGQPIWHIIASHW
jgi:hypothetical protein